MPYDELPPKTSGSVFSLVDYDTIRTNFAVGVPAIINAKGDLVIGSGVQSAGRLAVGSVGHTLIPDPTAPLGVAWHPQPLCVVTHNAEQDPDVDAWTPLAFAVENADSGTMHSTASNNSRINIPASGFYFIKAAAEFKTSELASGQSGVYGIRLVVNDTTIIEPFVRFEEETQAINTTRSLVEMLALESGDYVTCQVYTNRDIQITSKVRFWVSFQRVPVPT